MRRASGPPSSFFLREGGVGKGRERAGGLPQQLAEKRPGRQHKAAAAAGVFGGWPPEAVGLERCLGRRQGRVARPFSLG